MPSGPSPRTFTATGLRAIEAVAREHLERGYHTAAQLAVYRDGALVLDLRLGERAPGRAMDHEARMLWFSATKPLTAVCVLLLAERGQLDLDRPIADVWPEFAQGGKAACTPRHVLTHQGGFPVFPSMFDWERIGDWDAVTTAIAALPAGWPPGTAVGYHPMTYGFALGELIRRVDGRTPRDFMREEICAPLGLDASLGVDGADVGSVVAVRAMSEVTFDDPDGSERRTSDIVARFNAPATLRAQLPGANAVGTAEALARFYAMLERGGTLDGRAHPAHGDRARGHPSAGSHGERFAAAATPLRTASGSLLGPATGRSTSRARLGTLGNSPTVGYADPERGLAVAYITNGLHDPATVAIRHAEVAAAIIGACEV